MNNQVKALTLDIETAPLTVYTWDLYDQNVGLNQIKVDWHLLAWAAKWHNEVDTIYMDQRNSKDVTDDKKILMKLIDLINEADLVITQNGEKFDLKKIRARAVLHGLPPIKPVMSTDILKEGKKIFSFTSHKLEYLADKLNKKYKKLKHEKYPGFELWRAVLAGDKKAWLEMEKYTRHDVLSTEEAYDTLQGWIKTQPFSHSYEDAAMRCKCGGKNLEPRGYAYTEAGKYQIYHCLDKDCGKWPRSSVNLLSKEKRENTLRDTKGEK